MPVDVLVSGEDRFWVDAIAHQLDLEDGFQVVGRVTDQSDLLRQAPFCDVVAMHYEPRSGREIDQIQKILARHPAAAVVVIGLPDSATEILMYLEAGARGYVRACDGVDRLLAVLECAPKQRMEVDGQVAAAIASRLSELRSLADELMPAVPTAASLTAREMEILECVSRGMSNQQIADELFIAVGTVKNHVHNILHKLNVRDRRQAATLIFRPPANVAPAEAGQRTETADGTLRVPTPTPQFRRSRGSAPDNRITP